MEVPALCVLYRNIICRFGYGFSKIFQTQLIFYFATLLEFKNILSVLLCCKFVSVSVFMKKIYTASLYYKYFLPADN